MKEDTLLEQIWGEALELRRPEDISPLARLLGALLTVPTITLVSHHGTVRPCAMMEGTELLPGASLGDILSEELGLDVPQDAVVLIEPVEFADAKEFSGTDLGQELGRILMDIANCVTLPLIHGDGRVIPIGNTQANLGHANLFSRGDLQTELGRISPDLGGTGRQETFRAQ